MTGLIAALTELRSVRRDTVQALAALPPAALARPAPWRGATADIRFLLLRLADDDLMRTVRLRTALADVGWVRTEAHRILAAAVALRGRLMGSLAGLTPAQFDQGWNEGEWSVRRVLGHMIATDRRYLIQTQHAIERARSGGQGPLRPPDSDLPDRLGLPESEGVMDEVLARMAATHDTCIGGLADLGASDLDAPTNWMAWDLDVRFRLHRFAEHDREHLVQLRKTYAGIGFIPTEPQRILEEAGAARGALEALLVGVREHTPAAERGAAMLAEASAAEQEARSTILEAAKGGG